MSIDNTKVIDLNIKKEDKLLDFSDFQKQNIKFDISKLQEAYNQIVKTKKFEDGGGIAHFGAISLTNFRCSVSFSSSLTGASTTALLGPLFPMWSGPHQPARC